MNRRRFLKTLCTVTAATSLFGVQTLAHASETARSFEDQDLKDYLHNMANFDLPHTGDIILKNDQLAILNSTFKRLKRVQKSVGFGNFSILGFDEALLYAKNNPSIGSFTKKELNFLDYTFNFDATNYGFYGKRPIDEITSQVSKKDLIKISRTGNFLYRGQPYETYKSIKKLLGNKVYLTSGVRGIMKQFILFLAKASENNGNLSLASRSLAPPGYSFHGVGDFDVGERGLGAANFSIKFAGTETCMKLRNQGYLKLRYPKDNMLGVRFEPWHIKVKNFRP
jgi:zinc D-Ala-D-Ala carboxypeptidase